VGPVPEKVGLGPPAGKVGLATGFVVVEFVAPDGAGEGVAAPPVGRGTAWLRCGAGAVGPGPTGTVGPVDGATRRVIPVTAPNTTAAAHKPPPSATRRRRVRSRLPRLTIAGMSSGSAASSGT